MQHLFNLIENNFSMCKHINFTSNPTSKDCFKPNGLENLNYGLNKAKKAVRKHTKQQWKSRSLAYGGSTFYKARPTIGLAN